jgi:hypothetical protein
MLQLASGAVSPNESAGVVNLTVQRAGGDDGAVSVQYSTGGGSATAGSDYEATQGTLTWGNNDDGTRQVSVPILEDTEDEGNETFLVTLSNPTGGASLGSPAAATVTIRDNDGDGGPPPGPCVPDDVTLCLHDNRFRVTVHFDAPGFDSGPAHALSYTPASGFFWFFGEENIEVMIKVLNACNEQLGNRYWVFFAATTNVEFTVTVTDTQAEVTNTYFRPHGPPAAAETDTDAFATCP